VVINAGAGPEQVQVKPPVEAGVSILPVIGERSKALLNKVVPDADVTLRPALARLVLNAAAK
jgi:hypothetical protein